MRITVQPLRRGKYELRLSRAPEDIARAQELRHLAFVAQRGLGQFGGRDADDYDQKAEHGLICDSETGRVLACFRLRLFHAGQIATAYAAQFYDVTRLQAFPAPMLELGRFCLHPDHHDPDILRLAWGVITRRVELGGVGLLFGSSSFAGADIAQHAPALAVLRSRIAPEQWRPGRLTRGLSGHSDGPPEPEVIGFEDLPLAKANPLLLPPLLRSYLSMGAWVSDHLVVDRALDTLHVLTGVEIASIPPARARALRLIAAEIMG